MRSIVVTCSVFVCCVLAIVTVLTIGSYDLQRDEIERAVDYALEQTVRRCMEESISGRNEVAVVAANSFKSQINSKRGTLDLYILYADENIVDMYVSFVYTQYNGTEKEITCRKTIIKDWEDDDAEPIIRMISEKYLNQSPERGGLKENSVWKTNPLLKTILSNKQTDGEWENIQRIINIKTETKAEPIESE